MRIVMMMIPAFLCFSSFGQDHLKFRGCIGVDVTAALCNGCAGVNIAHAFSDRWSAGAEAYFGIVPVKSTVVSEYDIHESEFDGMRGMVIKDVPELRLYVAYWLSRPFQGAYLSSGILCSGQRIPEMIVGAGYSVRILDRLGVSLGGNIRIYESRVSGTVCTDGMEVALDYYF